MSRTLVFNLGELERAVMKRLWDAGATEVKELYQTVGRPRRITLNTVQSTAERLYRKGLLDRHKVSHAFVYAPRQSREAFGAELMHHLVKELLGGKLEPVLAAFVDLTARFGPKELARLGRLVAERQEAHGK